MDIFEIIEQLGDIISMPEVIICLVGLALWTFWLLKTSLGRDALANSVPRRNDMPAYLAFFPLFIWFGVIPFAVLTAQRLAADLQQWQIASLNNLIYCVGAIVVVAVIILLARSHFARRLEGFGLSAKTIIKDFFIAFVNLLSVWPLLLAAIILTMFFGKLVWGPDFYLEQHEELELITTYSQMSLRVLVVITAVIVAPVLEEMLFRGLIQTMIRSLIEIRSSKLEFRYRPWLAILISSGLFTMVHMNMGHWPALFILAMCLGYSYEKSGSLLRPIFIHSIFNSVAIISVLAQ